MAEYLAGAALAVALVIAFPCHAQSNSHAAQPKPQTPAPHAPISGPHETQRGHAGDWLRRYKDVPPDEQEQTLQNDPAFRRLPVARQEMLLRRLQHFSSLSPEEQLRMLNRMETWEHLTREQKQEARQIFRQIRQLPPDRRDRVRKAIDELRAMPPDQREAEINSDHFKSTFSDQERDVMREVTRLPLAPPEVGEGSPQE